MTLAVLTRFTIVGLALGTAACGDGGGGMGSSSAQNSTVANARSQDPELITNAPAPVTDTAIENVE